MIIGLAGKAGCGKTTVAKYLVAKHGFTEVSFATILKSMLVTMGFPEPSNRDDKEKLIEGFNFSWRHAAQTLGSNWARDCLDKDIWVKLTMKDLDPNKNYVFSDVRFTNESAAIEQAGGSLLLIEGRKVDLGKASTHASENSLDLYYVDAVIENTGTIEHLHDCVEDCIYNLTHWTK